MSKRFGRQQKRKFRAQVAQQEEQIARLERRVNELKFVGQRNADAVQEVRRILGANFIGLEPESEKVRALGDRQRWAVEKLRDLSEVLINPMGALPSTEPIEAVLHYLDILRGSAIVDDLRNQMHFRFMAGEKQFAYAVDRDALANMPFDLAIERVSAELASIFISDIQHKGVAA